MRLNDASLYYWDGESYDWSQILYWNVDHSPSGPGEAVNLDLSDGAGGFLAVDFHYNDAGWDWWAEVDQVVISDDSRADLLTEQFESSFPPGDWTVVNYQTYGWARNDSCYRTNYAGGSGYCADADSDWWYPQDTHLISPPVDCSGSTSVDLNFYASYNDIGGGDYFEVLLGVAEETETVTEDEFDDLSNWTAVDEGEYLDIQNTTWGEIKASF
ncbi:MAG: hypothetical protein A2Y64_07075 [Candidatus Coatesbacteria bacterium RBG_13_66_14]|uniref:Uncharacterized protein n=1 Tax=Candidatus Coatesbacteria bacterium RBG_13_66_14 TaxID=1817816 RepID=A0A1F5FFD0_9BACT|nr:MAG: hypothetical protein A2Y64_07075 [Candidatus Coatesbacteria bacterium RBG_13_66_14]